MPRKANRAKTKTSDRDTQYSAADELHINGSGSFEHSENLKRTVQVEDRNPFVLSWNTINVRHAHILPHPALSHQAP